MTALFASSDSALDSTGSDLYILEDVSGKALCSNVFLQRHGKIFGAKKRMHAVRWQSHKGRILFCGPRGRVRFIFEPCDGGFRGVAVDPPQFLGDLKDQTVQEFPLRLVRQAPFPKSKDGFEIVVAKYKEDASWTDCCLHNLTLYSKQVGDPEYIGMPNLGYECAIYFHHIVTRYDQLAERTLFLQGDPFAHPLFPLAEYATTTAAFAAASVNTHDIEFIPPWSKPGQQINGTVMRAFLRMIEYNAEVKSFQWTWGAQFSITRGQIHKRSRDYYQRLLELTQKHAVEIGGTLFDDKHVAYLLEFFWRQVFLVPD